MLDNQPWFVLGIVFMTVVLPLFMVVMKHILTGLQHGSPKRDAP